MRSNDGKYLEKRGIFKLDGTRNKTEELTVYDLKYKRRMHENAVRLLSCTIAYSFLNIQKADYSYMLCVAFQ